MEFNKDNAATSGGISGSAHNEEQDFYTADELLSLGVKDIPKMLYPLLPQIGVVALGGSSDTGKSAFLRQLAWTVANDAKEFLGFKLNLRYRKAIYVSTEDDKVATAALLGKLNNNENAD